jgi:hypothetical protein
MTEERAIANVDDPKTREAVIAVYSALGKRIEETYHKLYDRLDEEKEARMDVGKMIETHIQVCVEERRADEQWRVSATNVLKDFKKDVADLKKTSQSILVSSLVGALGLVGFLFSKLMHWM